MDENELSQLFHKYSKKDHWGDIVGYDVEKIIGEILISHRLASAELEAKVTAYEAILNNSNFKMAVVRKNKNGNHDGASKD